VDGRFNAGTRLSDFFGQPVDTVIKNLHQPFLVFALARWKTHRAISKLVLGKPHNDVNKVIDGPFKLLGKRHRALFHDPLSVLALFGDDPEKLKAGLLHLVVDRACRNRTVEKILVALASS